MKNIMTVFGDALDGDTAEIDGQLEELQNELVTRANSKEDYDAVVDEIYRLRSMKQEVQEHNVGRQSKRQCVQEMTDFLQAQDSAVFEYDDKLVRQLIERITVFEDRLSVVFKPGIEVDVEL